MCSKVMIETVGGEKLHLGIRFLPVGFKVFTTKKLMIY